MGSHIYVSTGAAREATAASWGQALLGVSNFPLELSGGAYSPRVRDELRELSAHTPIMLHNYFPPPEDPFVLNLASADPHIAKRSCDLVTLALDLSAEFGASHYAVHSGYCLDPAVSSLGRPLQGTVSGSRQRAVDALVANLGSLGEHAHEAGVRLLVENHVLAAFNLERFDENPLLMADPDEIELVIAELGGNVGLLMDVGHLKVSSHTLGFDLPEAMARLLPLAEGFHLSENGGMADDHLSFGDDAWFLPHLVGRQDFMTIEVHSTRFEDSVSAAIATRDFLQNGAPDA